MADMIKDWKNFQKELNLDGADLCRLAQDFRRTAEDALAGKKSSLSAAYLFGTPDGTGNGDLHGP